MATIMVHFNEVGTVSTRIRDGHQWIEVCTEGHEDTVNMFFNSVEDMENYAKAVLRSVWAEQNRLTMLDKLSREIQQENQPSEIDEKNHLAEEDFIAVAASAMRDSMPWENPKINAIKVVRIAGKMGLWEAKKFVDAHWLRLNEIANQEVGS